MLSIGQVISGKYRLVRLLGDGGMGSVYEAQHEVLGTRVAIKVLHADLARRTGLIDRFLQEAHVAAQIKSPHVVQVMDVDRTGDGVAYIVMELLEGEPLSAVLDRQGKIPVPLACEYTSQILCALEAAHALGVVHRDLKPENVFVTHAGGKPVLKLIDFGIAKLRRTDFEARSLTVAGVLMGTAEYMAPEQAYSADRVDARSDLYAVGVMLYEMIAGRRPVAGEDARVIAMKVERGEVTPLVHVAPEVPREIAGLVHRAMAARPELRFASATEMRLVLEGALGGKRVPTVKLPQAAEPLADASGTGTLKGAPSAEVLAAAAAARGHAAHPSQLGTKVEGRPATNTERAGPMPNAPPVALTPAPPLPYSAGGGAGGGGRSRRRGGLAWLILVPVILGGIVYGVYFMTEQQQAPPLPVTFDTSAPPITNVAPSAAATAATAAPNDTIAPLQPSPATRGRPGAAPAPTAKPGSPAPSGGQPPARPSAQPPESVPPIAFPSTMPSVLPFPIPSGAIPLPSGFPTSLPIPIPGFTPPPAPSGSSGSGAAPPPLPSAQGI